MEVESGRDENPLSPVYTARASSIRRFSTSTTVDTARAFLTISRSLMSIPLMIRRKIGIGWISLEHEQAFRANMARLKATVYTA
ncbi:hypothetical protein GE061_008940 [Apolygus lucorum]|uniref:Uncharacterized protein n=1 Tax=Apolygus lucorum TaxID=248454 RepID=A0A8S9Y0W7_APOLU|nr:hypothetical protein GE061_008940 [Apolygus lucorum]